MNIKPFESKHGFDANNNKLINLADPTNPNDGINLSHFEKYKNVISYDSSKGYEKGFVTLHDGKLYYSLESIPEPAGNFNPSKWNLILSPPRWNKLKPDTKTYQISSSEYLLVDTSLNELLINLPITPFEGDTIYVIDVGGNVGYQKLTLKSNRRNIKVNDTNEDGNTDSFIISTPNSYNIIIYINGFWVVKTLKDDISSNTKIINGSESYDSQSNERVINFSDTQELFTLKLPSFANNGDQIKYESITKNNTYIKVIFDDKNLTGKVNNKREDIIPTYRNITFTYNAESRGWLSTSDSKPTNINYISSKEYNISLNEEVSLIGLEDQVVFLPKNPYKNDIIKIGLSYKKFDSNVTINGNGLNILHDVNRLGLSSATNYIKDPSLTKKETLVLNSKTIDLRIESIILLFNGEDWVVHSSTSKSVIVNPTNPEIPGIIPLVNDTDITANVMTADNVAITPSQLQKRQSTELRKGIASIATQSEVNLGSTDEKIVTPKKLLAMKSSETQQGSAKLATQKIVDEGIDHTTIVTPKTLDNKLPNEDGKRGVVTYVDTKIPKGGSGRNSSGEGIYDSTDAIKVVTPKSLHQLISNENNIGLVFRATETEVMNGVADTPNEPKFVSPALLHKRTATTSRTGIAKLTSNTTIEDKSNTTDIVTPSTLYHVIDNKQTILGEKTFNDAIKFNIDRLKKVTGYANYTLCPKHNEYSPELLKELDLVPSNATSYEINDGEIKWLTDGEPDILNIYFYEINTVVYEAVTTIHEKLMSNGKYYIRHRVISPTSNSNTGWDMVYTTLNKPLPKEIGAIDKDDIIIGNVQVRESLDIIVDEENILRIYPDKDLKKVGFAWISPKSKE